MQFDKAMKLKRDAKARNLKCTHPELDKEYYLGSSTGDWVCTTCGESFSEQERDELFEAKAKKK
ncbi:MAG: hypothetical protein JSS79_05335 [Bacteroidetes bacterium]|nr:hypothetical protein [Bacteroidota bacterium]